MLKYIFTLIIMTDDQKTLIITRIAYKLRSMYPNTVKYFTPEFREHFPHTIMFHLDDGCYIANLNKYLKDNPRFIRWYDSKQIGDIYGKNRPTYVSFHPDDYSSVMQDIFNVFEKEVSYVN